MKTWEMIRDIKVGEIWDCTNDSIKVTKSTTGAIIYSNVGKDFGHDVGEQVTLYPWMVDRLKWRKLPKLVDFSEAIKALLDGKTIRAFREGRTSNAYFPCEYNYTYSFSTSDMQGKWEILDSE